MEDFIHISHPYFDPHKHLLLHQISCQIKYKYGTDNLSSKGPLDNYLERSVLSHSSLENLNLIIQPHDNKRLCTVERL